jgi:TolA-binding protein
VSVGQRRLELTRGPEPSRAPEAAVQAAPQPGPADAPPGSELPSAPMASAPAAAASPRADWREIARGGSLRKAFAAAEAAGFAAAVDAATAAELLELADAARLSGRADRANQALLALRTRYPGDPRRAAAAFMLGKVAFDQMHSYGQAAEWFKTSIREQPRGSLAREASGRLLEALRKSGDSAGARRAAEEYLARYPGGPHTDLARSLLR